MIPLQSYNLNEFANICKSSASQRERDEEKDKDDEEVEET